MRTRSLLMEQQVFFRDHCPYPPIWTTRLKWWFPEISEKKKKKKMLSTRRRGSDSNSQPCEHKAMAQPLLNADLHLILMKMIVYFALSFLLLPCSFDERRSIPWIYFSCYFNNLREHPPWHNRRGVTTALCPTPRCATGFFGTVLLGACTIGNRCCGRCVPGSLTFMPAVGNAWRLLTVKFILRSLLLARSSCLQQG